MAALVPGPNLALELQTIAIFLSSGLYGIAICLYALCCHCLIRDVNRYSTRKKWFLLCYATIMLVLSTFAIIEGMRSAVVAIFRSIPATQIGLAIFTAPASDVVLPITVWGADILMTWRCIVLYQGISRISRALLLSATVVLLLASLVSGIVFLAESPGLIQTTSLLALITISLAVNVILSFLISLRISYHQRYIKQTLGSAHGSLYTRVVVMCVESCGLIVACTLVALVLFLIPATGNQEVIVPLSLLPHICVISPLLLVYRVARGAEVSSPVDISEVVERGAREVLYPDIRFTSIVSPSRSNQEES